MMSSGDILETLKDNPIQAKYNREKEERMAKMKKEKLEKEMARKQAEYDKVWGWKKEGSQAWEGVQNRYQKIHGIVGPHKFKKQLGLDIERICGEIVSLPNRMRKPLSTLILERASQRHSKIQKSVIIRIFYNVLFQLQANAVSQHQHVKEMLKLTEQKAPRREEKVHQYIEKCLRRLIPIDSSSIKLLEEKRKTFHEATHKLNVISESILRNEGVRTCKSIQHSRPSGCPVCGCVIVKHEHLVMSVNRETGVETLMPLDFELQTLYGEKEAQILVVEHAGVDLDELEVLLRNRLAGSLQCWWYRRLARVWAQNQERKMLKSLNRNRVVRLAQMKQAVDAEFKKSGLPKFEQLAEKWYDVQTPLSEYFSRVLAKKAASVEKISKIFLAKLRKRVALTRRKLVRKEEMERDYLEMLAQAREKQRERKAMEDLRKRVHEIEHRNFTCIRPECNYRKFKSLDRYNTHLRLHQIKDQQKSTIAQTKKGIFEQREVEFSIMLERIKKTQAAINLEALVGDDESTVSTASRDSASLGSLADVLQGLPPVKIVGSLSSAIEVKEGSKTSTSHANFSSLNTTDTAVPCKYEVRGKERVKASEDQLARFEQSLSSVKRLLYSARGPLAQDRMRRVDKTLERKLVDVVENSKNRIGESSAFELSCETADRPTVMDMTTNRAPDQMSAEAGELTEGRINSALTVPLSPDRHTMAHMAHMSLMTMSATVRVSPTEENTNTAVSPLSLNGIEEAVPSSSLFHPEDAIEISLGRRSRFDGLSKNDRLICDLGISTEDDNANDDEYHIRSSSADSLHPYFFHSDVFELKSGFTGDVSKVLLEASLRGSNNVAGSKIISVRDTRDLPGMSELNGHDLLALRHAARRQMAVDEKQRRQQKCMDAEKRMAETSLIWTSTPHLWTLSADLYGTLYHLELLSKHGDVIAPASVPLNKPMMRFGTMEGCECRIESTGAAKRNAMIAKVHCMIFTAGAVDSSAEHTASVMVVDNSTLWGTYYVDTSGAYKVPTKFSVGASVRPGDLICIGVKPDGERELSPTDAGKACVVYRVRSVEIEHSGSNGLLN